MKKNLTKTICGFLLLQNFLFLSEALASSQMAKSDKILAIVNNEPITSFDLMQTKKIVIFFNNITKITPEIDSQLSSMSLDSLINQVLIKEQKNKFQLKITDDEIESSIRSIEDQNKLPHGYFRKAMQERHIEYRFFTSKIESDIILRKISQQIFVPNILVSKDEVDQAIINSNSKPVKLSLKVFSSNDASVKTHKSMDRLRKKLKDCNKLPKPSEYEQFATLKELSEDISQLSPLIKSATKGLRNNQVSSVLKTDDNFQILMVCQREVENISDEESNFVANSIGGNKLNMQTQRFYNNLRKKSYIKIFK
jgi:parvulin-like peptidyl-prolyl isomerase